MNAQTAKTRTYGYRTADVKTRRYSPARSVRVRSSRNLRTQRTVRLTAIDKATKGIEFTKLSVETISAILARVTTILSLFGIVLGS